jgi:hypothetical protein
MCLHEVTETHLKGDVVEEFCLECCRVIDTMYLDIKPGPLPATAEPPTDDER